MNGISTPLRVAYLLLTAGRPLSSREIADDLGFVGTGCITPIIDAMEVAGFVTEVVQKPCKGRQGYKNYFSARLSENGGKA